LGGLFAAPVVEGFGPEVETFQELPVFRPAPVNDKAEASMRTLVASAVTIPAPLPSARRRLDNSCRSEARACSSDRSGQSVAASRSRATAPVPDSASMARIARPRREDTTSSVSSSHARNGP
jgi:hypothetical protein